MGFFDKARGKLRTPFQEGAGLKMQAAWQSLPEWRRNQLRRTLKDSDHDGVPDKFDCQPFNSKRQDDTEQKSKKEWYIAGVRVYDPPPDQPRKKFLGIF